MSSTAPLMPAAQALAAGASEWIVPYAGGPADAAPAWAGLQLPRLRALLAQLTPEPLAQGSEYDFSPPHEVALARALGLPATPGLIPWAAHVKGGYGQACAFVTPAHWHVGTDHVRQMASGSELLDEQQSRQLLELLAPWFADDGITLEYLCPGRWLARGALFADLPTASLDRVRGRDVRPWLPRQQGEKTIERLQSEVQMLLYTHVFNDSRAERGLPPVNAFWVHGSGQLAGPAPQGGAVAVACIDDLRASALQADTAGWRAAWQRLDEEVMSGLLQRLERGEDIALTLCGERHAMRFTRQARGPWQKILRKIRPMSLPNLPELL